MEVTLSSSFFSFKPAFIQADRTEEIVFSDDGRSVRAAGFDLSFASKVAPQGIIGGYKKLIVNGLGWKIEISPSLILLETDWLGMTNIYIDEKENIGGSDHKCLTDLTEIDPVGLDLYLRYGYCCLGKTPFENIRILGAKESVSLRDGCSYIADREDPFLPYTQRGVSSVDEIISLLSEWFVSNHGDNNSEIIIPLTGGYDSRLLTAVCREVFPSRKILSPTYSVSAVQNWSHEVVVARSVATLLNTKHKIVPLEVKNWNRKVDQWIELRGFSSHAHGMHFINFYEYIRNFTDSRFNISGLYGDVWSGNYDPMKSSSVANDFEGYFNPHGMTFNNHLKLEESRCLVRQSVLDGTKDLPEKVSHTVLMARNKIPLINYLFGVPDNLGFQTSSPFIEPEIAAAMMHLPAELRGDRKWLSNYFSQEQLNIRTPLNPISRSNVFFVRCCLNTSFKNTEDANLASKLPREDFVSHGIVGRLKLIIDIAIEYIATVTKIGLFIRPLNQYTRPIFGKMVRYYHLQPLIKVAARRK